MSWSTVYWLESRHLGVVRDRCPEGIFVLTHFLPSIGDKVVVVIDHSPFRHESVTGTVLRVEEESSCGLIGIAIRIGQPTATLGSDHDRTNYLVNSDVRR